MRSSLGQPLVMENVTGANGNLGTGRVARAKPDGYTIAFSVSFSTHVVNGAIYTLPYDVINDFEPVALVADAPQVILAKKAMPANDLKELTAWLKANPDKASLGHTGPGSPAHVAGIFSEADRHPLPVRNLSECRPSDAGYDRRAHRFDVRQPQHCFGARARRQY